MQENYHETIANMKVFISSMAGTTSMQMFRVLGGLKEQFDVSHGYVPFGGSSPSSYGCLDGPARSVTQPIHQQFDHLSRICGLFAVSPVA
jgi:hypothetical protein